MDSTNCIFCVASHPNILLEHPLAVARCDGYPVSKGHCLIIPRRHVASFFECTSEERAAMMELLDKAKAIIDREHASNGYNIDIAARKHRGWKRMTRSVGQLLVNMPLWKLQRVGAEKLDFL